MNDETYFYYWKCEDCKLLQKASSLQDAKEQLEKHEVEFHKGKPIGAFGKSKKNENIT